MRIIVCMKQVIDPESPASTFRIDPDTKRALPPEGSPPVLSPFDQNALEAALKIKDEKGAEVLVLSLGRQLSKPVLQRAVAAGADDVIMLQDEAFDDMDSYATAELLAGAIRKLGNYDLILCGRQASDTNAGQVGTGIAEVIGIPCITVAKKIQIDGSNLRVERTTTDGFEVIEASMPAVITANSEIGDLRMPSVKAVMASRKKALQIWGMRDLALEMPSDRKMQLVDIGVCGPRVGSCTIIEGTSAAEAGEKLALALREAKVI